MDETKNYQLDLSLLRVMPTILVVFDHAFYIFTYGQLSDLNISEIYPFTFIIKSFFAIVNMPIFVLISGYLFYKKYVYNQVPVSKTSILKKKASRLLLPYLAFAPIVLLSKGQLVSWIYHPLQPIGHLWFLLMLFGVTAIYIPLISFQNSQRNRIFVFLIMLIISIAIPACVAHFDEFSDAWSIVTLNRFGIGGGNTLSVNEIILYLPLFSLGGLLVNYRLNTIRTLWIGLTMFALAIIFFVVTFNLFTYGNFTIGQIVRKLFVVVFVVAVYFLVKVICHYDFMRKFVSCRFIQSVDKYSFSIYLFNSLFVDAIISTDILVNVAFIYPRTFGMVTFIVVFVSSYLISVILSKTKFYRSLLGIK